jgi:hypothetical protein
MLSSLFRCSETVSLQASLLENRFLKGQHKSLQRSVANKGRDIKALNGNLYDVQVLIADSNYRFKLQTLCALSKF